MPFVFKEIDGLGLYEVSGWEGARGIFTTRLGGVSPAPYDSLNLGGGSGDDPALVAKNRALLAGALGLKGRAITTVNQVHGDGICVVDGGDRRPRPDRDAMITNERGVALGVVTADCAPVLMYDPVRGAVASVHAGWAGTVKGIAGGAVMKMGEVYGSRPADLKVAIGPSIGPCCYEVGMKVMGPLGDALPGASGLASPSGRNGRFMLDLWETNRRILLMAGVRPGNIAVMGLCTACNPNKFFSHRKSGGRAGRMMAVALLK